MAACSLLMAFIGTDWPVWLVVVICAAFGATAIGWNGVYLAEVARLAPAGQAGLMTGGTLFFTYLGVVIGPPFFPPAMEATAPFAWAIPLWGAPRRPAPSLMAAQLRPPNIQPS